MGGGYYGNTSGAGLALTLPHSGLRLSVPLWKYSMDVSTPERPIGVQADVRLEPSVADILAGRDAVLEAAVAMALEAAAAAAG